MPSGVAITVYGYSSSRVFNDLQKYPTRNAKISSARCFADSEDLATMSLVIGLKHTWSGYIYMQKDEQEVQQILQGKEYPSLDIAFEEAKRVLDFQFSQIDGLDTKASILLGFSGVLLPVFLTALPSMLRYIDLTTQAMAVGTLVSLSFSAIVAIIAITLKVYSNAPTVESLLEKYLAWQEKHTKYHLLHEFKRVFAHNSDMIRPKIRFVRWSLVLLEIGIVLSLATLLYQLK